MIEGSSTVEYKTIRQTLAEQRGRLEEFNLLCNNVQASLEAFWSRWAYNGKNEDV